MQWEVSAYVINTQDLEIMLGSLTVKNSVQIFNNSLCDVDYLIVMKIVNN